MAERDLPRLVTIVAGASLALAAFAGCDNNSVSKIEPTVVPIPSSIRPTASPTRVSSPEASSLNRALKLDGLGDSVEFDGKNYNFEVPIRIEARIRLADSLVRGVRGDAIVSKGGDDAIAFFGSFVTCPEKGMAVVVGGGQPVCGPNIQPNIWQDVAAEYDGESVTFFQNNKEVAKKPWKGSVPIEQGNINIGRSTRGTVTQEFFKGEFDSLKIIDLRTKKEIFNASFSDFKDSVTGTVGVAKGDAQLVVVE